MSNIQKQAAGFRSIVSMLKKSPAGQAVSEAVKGNIGKTLAGAGIAGAGAGAAGAYRYGKKRGVNQTAAKFNDYNQKENRYLVNKAYQMGKNASVEEIALDKIANGHGQLFIEALCNQDGVEKTASAQGSNIEGYEDYTYNDLGSVEKMASKSAYRALKSGLSAAFRSAKSKIKKVDMGKVKSMASSAKTKIKDTAKKVDAFANKYPKATLGTGGAILGTGATAAGISAGMKYNKKNK